MAGNVQGLGALPAQPQPFFVALGKLFNWFCNSTVCQEREWERHCFFSSFYLSADDIKISGVQTLCVCVAAVPSPGTAQILMFITITIVLGLQETFTSLDQSTQQQWRNLNAAI